jgi:putative ABC transport system substrate-binding protein
VPVAVIVTLPSSPAALAAKAATAKLPIIFSLGADAVELGLVTSYNLPGGNVTGVSVNSASLTPKRIELLDGLVAKSAPVAILVNPTNRNAGAELKLAGEAARALGRDLIGVQAGTESEIDAGFTSMVQQGAAGLVVWQEAFFESMRDKIVALAQRYRLPAIYPIRQFPEIGGFISYGTNTSESYHQVGIYVGRILHGEKAADLPVVQPTKFELIINLKPAKTLGLEIPPTLLARADEVIE